MGTAAAERSPEEGADSILAPWRRAVAAAAAAAAGGGEGGAFEAANGTFTRDGEAIAW